jgi:hypothetical protein
MTAPALLNQTDCDATQCGDLLSSGGPSENPQPSDLTEGRVRFEGVFDLDIPYKPPSLPADEAEPVGFEAVRLWLKNVYDCEEEKRTPCDDGECWNWTMAPSVLACHCHTQQEQCQFQRSKHRFVLDQSDGKPVFSQDRQGWFSCQSCGYKQEVSNLDSIARVRRMGTGAQFKPSVW